MFSRLSVIVCLVAISAAADTKEPLGDNSPRMWTVTLTAKVDGSGVFQFSDEAMTYKHKHWKAPTNVQLNGHPWQDLNASPEDWAAHRGTLDLTNAWVVRREGRDTVAFEKTKTGFSVFMTDSPNGAGNYSTTIAIPLLESAP
jgi:hypothetical protein